MWWGSGEPPDGAVGEAGSHGGSSSSSSSSTGPATGQQVEQELHHLQEQFAAQQQMLGNLKTRVPQTSTHQDYATRLAAMRSRLSRPQQKASKQQKHDRDYQQQLDGQSFHTESVSVDPSVTPFEVVHKNPVQEEQPKMGGSLMDVSGAGTSVVAAAAAAGVKAEDDPHLGTIPKKARTSSFSEGTKHSKMQLLRKQLDENRTKFEKQQRDNRNKKASMEEMKKKMDKLRSEIEKRDAFIKSFEEDIVPLQAQATTQQLCQQLLQKDAIVMGLTTRLNELDTLTQDLKERLEEKESIVVARTEAVTLVTRDRDEKQLKMMEDLEERHNNMREMQQHFTDREEEWKRESNLMSKLLAEKSGRVAQLEENCHRTESIRFDLSTRNAELQEKIVAIQQEREQLESNLSAEKKRSAERHSNTKELKQRLCKAEAYGAKKMKNLEKQLKSIKQDGGEECGQKLLDLHNQLAVLEEEKGNLQLRLVDFDELKACNTSLEGELATLSNKLRNVNRELDSKSASVSSLENEKGKFVELLNDRDSKLINLETNILKFEDENQKICSLKTDLEARVMELENKLSCAEAEQPQVEAMVEETRELMEQRVVELTETLSILKAKSEQQDEDVSQYKELCQQAEETQLNTSEANQRLLAILTDKEDYLTNQSIEIDKLNDFISSHLSEIEELNNKVKQGKLDRDNCTFNFQVEINNLQEIIVSKETELENLVDNQRIEASKFTEAIEKANRLGKKMNSYEISMNEAENELSAYKERNTSLNIIVDENEKLMINFKDDVTHLKGSIEADNAKIQMLKLSVSNLESTLSKLQSDKYQLQNLNVEVHSLLGLKSKEMEKLQKDYLNNKQSLADSLNELQTQCRILVSLTEEKRVLEQLLQQEKEQAGQNWAAVKEEKRVLEQLLQQEKGQAGQNWAAVKEEKRVLEQLLQQEKEQAGQNLAAVKEEKGVLEQLLQQEKEQAGQNLAAVKEEKGVLEQLLQQEKEQAGQNWAAVKEEKGVLEQLLQQEKEQAGQNWAAVKEENGVLEQLLQQEKEQAGQNLAAVKEELTQTLESIVMLEHSRDCEQVKFTALEKANSEKCWIIEEMKNQLANSATEQTEKDSSLNEQNRIIMQYTSDVDHHKQYNDELNRKLQEKETVLSDTLQQIASLNVDIEGYKSRLQNNDAMITEINQHLREKEALLFYSEEKLALFTTDTKSDLEITLTRERQSWMDESQTSLQEKQSELDSLTQKLSDCIAEISSLTDDVAAKEATMALAEEKLLEKEVEHKTLRVQFEELTQWYEQVNLNNSNIQEQLEQNNSNLDAAKTKYNDKESKVKELEEQFEVTLGEMQDKQKQITVEQQGLEEKIVHLEAEDIKKAKKINEVQDELINMQSELSGSKQYSEEMAQCQVLWEEWSKVVQEEKAASQEELDTSKAALLSQAVELQQNSEALTEALQGQQSLETSVHSLTDQLKEKCTIADDGLEQKSLLESKLSILEQQLVDIQSQNVQAYDSSVNDAQELRERMLHLDADLAASSLKVNEVTEQLNVKSCSIDELTQKLRQKEEQLNQESKSIELLKHEFSVKEDQLTSESRRVEEIQQNINTKDETVIQLGSQLSEERLRHSNNVVELQQQLHHQQEQMQQQQEQLRVHIQQLKQQESSRSSSRHSDHSDEDIQQQCRVLQLQLDEALLKITQLETSLATSSMGVDSITAADDECLLGEIDLSDSFGNSAAGVTTSHEVLRLQQALVEKSQLVEQMQEQLRTLKQSSHSQDREMALLVEKTQSYEEKCKEMQSICQHLQEQLQQQMNAANDSLPKIIALEMQVNSLNGQLETITMAHSQQLQEQSELQKQQFCEQINTLKSRILAQKNNIENLQEQLLQKEALAKELDEKLNSKMTQISTANAAVSLFSSSGEENTAAGGVDWFNSQQQQQSEEKIQFSSIDPQASEVLKDDQQTAQKQEQSSQSTSELEFKLAWYEGEWTTWTTHYNELQQSYNEAQTNIAELRQLLEEQQATTGVPEVVASTEGVDIDAGTDVEVCKSATPVEDSVATFHSTEQYNTLYTEHQDMLLHYQKLKEYNEQLSHAKAQVDEELDMLRENHHQQTTPGCDARITAAVAELELSKQLLQAELSQAQQQIVALTNQLEESHQLLTQLHDAQRFAEKLQMELQTMQQQGGGSAGSSSSGRVRELELMVESAETEIARLKGQLQLQQEERVMLSERLLMLESEVNSRREFPVEAENAELASRDAELVAFSRENSTLRSELEVMEGEHSRRTTDVEILESENNRLRTDMEMATQAAQILDAEKESLLMEIQRLMQEQERLDEQVRDSQATCDTANEQIHLLNQQLINMQQQQQQYHQQQHYQQSVEALVADDELDWGSEGSKEVEHIQRQTSQGSSLKNELEALKQELISIEKEKNGLSDELQASKVKCGRLLQKVKANQSKNEILQKEVERLKTMKGGLSGLDQALEDEFKAQVMQAQTERDELKQRLEEVLKEKDQSVRQCEVLKDAHERFIEMKEDQDSQIRVLRSRNKEMASETAALEWKVSELIESVEEMQQQQQNNPSQLKESGSNSHDPVQNTATDESGEQTKQLKDQIIALENQLDELSSSNMKIESLNKDLNERYNELDVSNKKLMEEKQQLEAGVLRQGEENRKVRENASKASKDVNVYKEAFIQQQVQFEKLTDEKSSLDHHLAEVSYQRRTIAQEYNALHQEAAELRISNDTIKYELTMTEGDRDRLRDDLDCVNATLEAFRQDRLEDTVRALEEENASLREACFALKEEITRQVAEENGRQHDVDRLKVELHYSQSTLKSVQDRLIEQQQSERMSENAMATLEHHSKYNNAQMAVLVSKNTQLTQEVEAAERECATLQQQVRHWQQQSQHLSRQVESADASLSRLSGGHVSSNRGSDAVQRDTGDAELDAALASLHLRDLRCHQLIMEINKLVEERDSLQLRLSSALRNVQELVRQHAVLEGGQELHHSAAVTTAQDAIRPHHLMEGPLKTKLKQLRELNDEVEQRTLSSLPPTPVTSISDLPPSPFGSYTAPSSPIIKSEYTLTRETQATSSTLINWIMGRTTPKVMHV